MNKPTTYSKRFLILVLSIFVILVFGASALNSDAELLSESLVFPSVFLFAFYLLYKYIIFGSNIDWVAPDIFFLILFYLFHFSYLYLYLLGLADYEREVFFNPAYIPPAVFFCTLCVASFLIGYNLIGFKQSKHKYISMSGKNLDILYLCSKILLVFSFLMFWVPLLSIFSKAFSDYKVLISIGNESPLGKLYWIGQYLGVAALSTYYLCRARLGGNRDVFYFLALAYILSYLIIGDRGGFLYYIIIPILATNMLKSKIKLNKVFFYGSIILIVSSAISATRTNSIYNPIDIYAAYADKDDMSPVVDALVEFGTTFKTIPIAMTYVPYQYEYWMGKSYLDALMITLPNFTGTRVSSSVETWLTETAFGPISETYGRGGSIAMESFVNFGEIGSYIFFFILGMLIALIYKKLRLTENIFYGVIYFSLMASLCLWMRNSSSILFRTVIWSLIFCYLSTSPISVGLFKRYINSATARIKH